MSKQLLIGELGDRHGVSTYGVVRGGPVAGGDAAVPTAYWDGTHVASMCRRGRAGVAQSLDSHAHDVCNGFGLILGCAQLMTPAPPRNP